MIDKENKNWNEGLLWVRNKKRDYGYESKRRIRNKMDQFQAALLKPTFLLHKRSLPTRISVNILSLSYFCEEFIIKYNFPVFW